MVIRRFYKLVALLGLLAAVTGGHTALAYSASPTPSATTLCRYFFTIQCYGIVAPNNIIGPNSVTGR